MAEERLTLADLGFEFGPDPLSDAALVAKFQEFTGRPGFAWAMVVFGVVAAYWVWTLLRAAKERRDAVDIVEGREAQTVLRRGTALAELRKRDPGFDEAAFLEHAAAIFLKVQAAWSNHSLPSARPFVSDGFHERLRDEIARQQSAGVRHALSELELRETEFLGCAAGHHYDAVAVRFKVSAVRSRHDGKTGAKLDGGHETYEEVWTFVRRLAATTGKAPGAFEGSARAAARRSSSPTRRAARRARPGSTPAPTTGSR
ncbi:MAG: Tim44-like domain-containing protein [Elusimicrobiota bacterium]|nr:MAG: Tim44-like domain-containing protein [Elusimicrobiota bacterium]